MNNNDRSFYFEDCYQMHSLYPETFSIPTQREINRLEPDDEVKLIFVLKNQIPDYPTAERMWVSITDIHDYEIEENNNGVITKVQRRKFSGTLDNEPYFIQDINIGDLVEFEDKNIASTNLPFEDSVDIDDFCLISQKAIDKKKSELVMRYLSPQFEKDSGWRFYFGDEEDEKLLCKSDKSLDELNKIEKNVGMTKQIIKEVINKIHLLQDIIEEEEGIFKFSKEDGKYVKLHSFINQ